MCGIVGVCGKILVKEENIFKTLLCLDTIRGPDSTGILGVSASTGFEIFKKVGTPWHCFGDAGFEKIFKYTNVLLLGHNRAATVGAVNQANAHPFDVGEVIGVHNGTLRNESRLKDNDLFSVDSETLLHNFAVNGVSETVKIVDGAFSVVFYDKRDHTIHFLRNKERPLFYTFSEDNKTLLWASEAWMLSITCARFGYKISEVHELPEMVEFSFPLPRQSSPSKVDVIPEITKTVLTKEVKIYEHPWGAYSYVNQDNEQSARGLIVVPKGTMGAKDLVNLHKRKLMASFLGKDVNFSVSGFVEGKHQKFIRAYAELDEADVVEIRIFMDKKNQMFGQLCEDKENFWTGHVKRVSSVNAARGYLLLDNRSIKVYEPRVPQNVINAGEKCFNLYHNKPVTAQQWLDATSCGCDNCGTIPQLREAADLNWYDDDKFFCGTCYKTQNVQNYLSLLPED